MKDEDMMIAGGLLVGAFVGACWVFDEEIKTLWYTMDVAMLSGLQYLPVLGEGYAQMLRDYQKIGADWPSYMQYLTVGQTIWRPLFIVVFAPLVLKWAWAAHKKRSAQGFDTVNQAYIDKHYRLLRPSPTTRQQYTVRRWFHHYGLHRMEWDSEEWHQRIGQAFAFQLGPPSDDPESQALMLEFATVIKKELDASFGASKVKRFEPKEIVRLATERHAYRTPAMVRILAAARDDYGVVSPNRIQNRLFESADTVPVWFSLNGLGRQTTHIESLGALSHFYVEVAYGESLETPQFRNAVKGLDQYREHLLEQLKMPDLDESEQYREVPNYEEDEPRYDYSLSADEDHQVAAR